VTECDINYNGSISIDEDLLDLCGIKEFERVDVFNINNGARFSTYVILGKRGSGEIGINGAAARLAQPGDKVIIVNFGMFGDNEIANHKPNIVVLDDQNKVLK
jgi:aspartate 1-decarboxylase